MKQNQLNLFILVSFYSLIILSYSFKIEKSYPSLEKFQKYKKVQNQPILTDKVQKGRLLQSNLTVNILTKTLIQNKKFTNLTLDHEIPLNFVKGELFQIRGRVSNQPKNSISVNLVLKNQVTGQKFVFSSEVDISSLRFSILVDFNVPSGNYSFTLFPGEYGFTQKQTYTVLSIVTDNTKKFVSSGPAVTGFAIDVIKNQLILTWNQAIDAPLQRITFIQEALRKEYILSNFQTKFNVPFKDFFAFNASNVVVSLQQASSTSLSLQGRTSTFSRPSSITFLATRHNFDQYSTTQIKLNYFPWRIKVGSKIVINGSASVNLRNRIITEQPNKTLKSYYFKEGNQSAVITANSLLCKQITFISAGVYILQINNIGGIALLNRPIYVGSAYPLLPDFVDLSPNDVTLTPTTQSISQQKSLILTLINQKRLQWSLDPLTFDLRLSTLAQMHSDDMVNRSYFAHNTPEGLSPQDRANSLGFVETVGQNLAINFNLTEAHLRLCRSPSHLENIIRQDWQRVGTGITINDDQAFVLTNQFAGRNLLINPLTSSEYTQIKSDIVAYALQNYASLKSQNPSLSSALSQWQNLQTSQQSQKPLNGYLQSKGFGSFSIATLKVPYSEGFQNDLQNAGYFKPSSTNYRQIGVTIKSFTGNMEVLVAYLV